MWAIMWAGGTWVGELDKEFSEGGEIINDRRIEFWT